MSQTEYEVQNIEANGDDITIWIIGDGPLPDTSNLVSSLQEPIGQEVIINLVIVPSQKMQIELLSPGERD